MLDGLTRGGTLGLGMLVTLIAAAAADSTGGTDSLQGFSSRTAAVEEQLEQRFDSGLSAADPRAWMKQLSSAPNPSRVFARPSKSAAGVRRINTWGWSRPH